MLALVIIAAKPGGNPSLGFGNARIGIEVDFLVFEASPQSLDEDVVHAAALAVHADRDVVTLQRTGEVIMVNWLPWSVLKISGRPWRASASSSAATENSAVSVFDSRHASTARLTQSMMTTR